MTDLNTRLAAWYLGRRVQPEATQWPGQVLDAMDDLRLVVIDPEDREQVAPLRDALDPSQRTSVAAVQSSLRALITSPSPDEPTGLGAVIEDAEGFTYVRNWPADTDMTHPWYVQDRSSRKPRLTWRYDEIAVVKILSDGWRA